MPTADEVKLKGEFTDEIGIVRAKCIACGLEFVQRTKWQEFCSNQHRAAWRESIQYLGQEYKQTAEGAKRFWTILKVKLDSFEEREASKAQKEEMKKEDAQILKSSETWKEWIERNYKTEDKRKAFIDENYGETYISEDQIVGETSEQFVARAKKGT